MVTWLEYKHNVLNQVNPPDFTGSVTTFSHTEPISGFYYTALPVVYGDVKNDRFSPCGRPIISYTTINYRPREKKQKRINYHGRLDRNEWWNRKMH